MFTLDLLCTGSLAGVFDGPTSQPIDLDAPAVSVDISAVKAAGDKLLTAAMLCTWSYGFGCVDAASRAGRPRRRPRPAPTSAVMDELWRALRGAPGLVEHADSLTRLNRASGMAHIMITHSLADLDALATEEDRAKARGFMDRSAITVLAGLPPRELARVAEITPLTGPERALVASWSAPESYQPGARHPGRGKYLIKTGERLGIPVQLTLVGPEHRAVRHRPGHPGQSGPTTRSGARGEPGAGTAAIGWRRRDRSRAGPCWPPAGRLVALAALSGPRPGSPPRSPAAGAEPFGMTFVTRPRARADRQRLAAHPDDRGRRDHGRPGRAGGRGHGRGVARLIRRCAGPLRVIRWPRWPATRGCGR